MDSTGARQGGFREIRSNDRHVRYSGALSLAIGSILFFEQSTGNQTRRHSVSAARMAHGQHRSRNGGVDVFLVATQPESGAPSKAITSVPPAPLISDLCILICRDPRATDRDDPTGGSARGHSRIACIRLRRNTRCDSRYRRPVRSRTPIPVRSGR